MQFRTEIEELYFIVGSTLPSRKPDKVTEEQDKIRPVSRGSRCRPLRHRRAKEEFDLNEYCIVNSTLPSEASLRKTDKITEVGKQEFDLNEITEQDKQEFQFY